MYFHATEATGNGVSLVSVEFERGMPIETLVRTHINVYNPNDYWVNVTKYFVKVLPENSTEWDGRTLPIAFPIPPRKGFEIDCDDVRTWPPDPDNPIDQPLCEFYKGFVIIESWSDLPLEVVAVYDKESVDIVNKITFRLDIREWTVDTPKGTFEFNRPYAMDGETIVGATSSLDDGTYLLNYTEKDIAIEIVSVTTYFDFIACVPKDRIVFIVRATNLTWQKFLNETWPEHPSGFMWPSWFKSCSTLEKVVKIQRLDEIMVPEEIVRKEIKRTLIDLGVPLDRVNAIMRHVQIEIIEVDVAEGLGTSRDVEYIEPEIIP